jgi:ketosteroid isomerase-like protein
MSQQNVELVLSMQPDPQTDLVRLLRDDGAWAIAAGMLSAAFAEDAEIVTPGFFDLPETLEGVEGLRTVWLQWLAPWTSYRAEIEDATDLGDRVLLHVRDRARSATDSGEVAILSAAVYTVRDAKIVRVEFYADRREALKALGGDE